MPCVMLDKRPYYGSGWRGVGWYQVDAAGKIIAGPFATEQECPKSKSATVGYLDYNQGTGRAILTAKLKIDQLGASAPLEEVRQLGTFKSPQEAMRAARQAASAVGLSTVSDRVATENGWITVKSLQSKALANLLDAGCPRELAEKTVSLVSKGSVSKVLEGKWDSKHGDKWWVSVRVGGKGAQHVGQVIPVNGKNGRAAVRLEKLIQDYGDGDVAIFEVDPRATA